MDRALAYATLELSAEATPEDVRTAYRRRAFATHPDRAGGDAAAFRAVSEAYRSLSDPVLQGAQEPGPASGSDGAARVPPTDAAKVLFEYLSDLASDMILNGATPEVVVSFLAREGCPESVARALEQDLRDRVQPEPLDPGAESRPPDPSPARRSARSSPGWLPVAAGVAAIAACVAGALPLARRALASLPPAGPPAAVAVVPAPAPTVPPSAPAPARPPPSAPARPSAQQAPRPATRDRRTASLRSTSGELDAGREALEADQRRFAAEAAELDAESARIDAAEAALASAPDPRRSASLASAKAAYNARVERARRTEQDLQRRVRELNSKITAYNERVRAGR